tara:strand:- start:1055 stop:2986 length:1932 start_codon:yes stop_codon:yes gene_type:complete
MIRLNYRPEIDSLRAIAVLGVIIYHAKLYIFGYQFFTGGYLGVDIFFVISGYLIFSLIYKELQIYNKLDFKNFYERRARRILPALIFVILVSFIFSWKLILPTSFIDYSKSVIYSLVFSSNFYFFFSGQLYGAESGLLKPLLHTWSLSVEEQFYIIFPLFTLLFFKYLNKYIFYLFIFISILSFALSQFLSIHNPSLNFYFLTSRIWEVLCGAMLVFFENKNKKTFSNLISNFFVFIGLVLIILSFLLIETNNGPSIISIFSIIGTMIVIYFSKPKTLMSLLLSNKILVGIGLISYSLYLWHYPIFSFYRIYFLNKSVYYNLIIILLIFSLSFLTYYFVEKPFRDKNKISLKKIIRISIFIFSFLLIFTLMIVKNEGYVDRFSKLEKFSLDNFFYIKEKRLKNFEIGDPIFTNSKKKNKILIIGNSLGQDLFDTLYLNKELFPNHEFSMIYNQIHCFKKIFKSKNLCDKKISYQDLENINKSDIILINTHYYPEDMGSLDLVIKNFKQKNKNIIITYQHPTFYHIFGKTLLDEFFIKNNRLPNEEELIVLEKKQFMLMNNFDIKSEYNNESYFKNNQKLRKIAIENKIKILNQIDYLCISDDKKCLIMTDDQDKIFLNQDHITLSGAKFLGKKIYETNWLGLN